MLISRWQDGDLVSVDVAGGHEGVMDAARVLHNCEDGSPLVREEAVAHPGDQALEARPCVLHAHEFLIRGGTELAKWASFSRFSHHFLCIGLSPTLRSSALNAQVSTTCVPLSLMTCRSSACSPGKGGGT